MHKKLLFIAILWLCAIAGMAQKLEIVQDFKKNETSSAVVMYHNQFGKYEKPAMDDTFPYAVVRVLLEGNAKEVTAAKKMLGVYTGVLSQGLKASYLDFENEILFLVPSSSGHVELSCGDGCARQTILELPKLESNALYMGKVHYRPAAPLQESAPEVVKTQYFKFRLTPANASVAVSGNGEEMLLVTKEGGLASGKLKFGTYHYRITADRYYPEEGNFEVSESQTEMAIALRPQFGWLTVTGNLSTQGAYIFATNKSTGVMMQLGTIPLTNKELDEGEYTLHIQKEQYKDYSTALTITSDNITNIDVALEENFAVLTLATQTGADIYMDGDRIATSTWTGTLELGKHTFETRQASHKTAYTVLDITPQSNGKTLQLKKPIPIYGSLAVEGTPDDANVYVDGRKVGTTPLVVNDLLIGSHQVRIEKENYTSDMKEVTVVENKESLLEYALIQTTTPTAPPPATAPKTSPVREQEKMAKNDKGKSNTPVKSKMKTFILANAATPFKANMWGVGLTFGQMYNGHGWYLKGRSNFQALKTLSGLQCDDKGAFIAPDDSPYFDYNGDYINDVGVVPFYSGNTKASTWLVNVGYSVDFLHKKALRNKHSAMGMYVGLGYGAARYGLETTNGQWIEYAPWSAMGVSADLGLMVSMGGFTIAAGVTTINFKTVEAEFSVGCML